MPVLPDHHSNYQVMSKKPITREVLLISAMIPITVNIGMAQREELSLESTEEPWTYATFLELANAQSKHFKNNTHITYEQSRNPICRNKGKLIKI